MIAWIRKLLRDLVSYREKRNSQQIEKTEALDFRTAAQERRNSEINVTQDYIKTSCSFSFAGGDRSKKKASLSATRRAND